MDERRVRERSRLDAIRDRVAHRVCNFTINRVASPWYRVRLERVIRSGMRDYAKTGRDE